MKYFTIKEMCNSNTAKKYKIINTPGETEIKNLSELITKILDPLRVAYGKPIHISSGFRNAALNAKVGGVKTSLHIKGLAADIQGFDYSNTENRKLFDLVKKLNLPFDLLINEKPDSKGNPNWVHVSYKPDGRKQILIIK